jgi:hypothetical protein
MIEHFIKASMMLFVGAGVWLVSRECVQTQRYGLLGVVCIVVGMMVIGFMETNNER